MFVRVDKSLNVHGVRIAYTECGPQDGRVLFCVHGLLSNGRDYDFLAQRLAQSGYRVVCMDLPGRGKSDWLTDKTQYQPPFYIPYCLALISEVTKGVSFDWFGVSLGGMIGLALSVMDGVKLERLILVDIGAEIPAAGLDSVAKLAKFLPEFKTQHDAVSFLKIRCSQWGITEDAVWDHLIAHNIKPHDGGYIMHYDPAIGVALPEKNETLAFWDLWRNVRQPVLLIRGKESALLPLSVANAMRGCYGGKFFYNITFEGCGHVPNLMEDMQINKVVTHIKAPSFVS